MVGKLAITGPHFTMHMSEIASHLDAFRYDEGARTEIWHDFADDYDRDNGDASSITDGFHACESMGWLLHDMREHMGMLHDPNNYSLNARPDSPPIG